MAEQPEESARERALAAPTPAQAQRRKPGKQPGAPGAGRTQRFVAHAAREHRPRHCARCGQALPPEARATAYTAFQTLDVVWGETAAPGLHLRVLEQRYLEATCACGHRTRACPHRGETGADLDEVALGEWRLVGPGLASLIVSLHLRFRLSRARIREFLDAWLGVSLSVGAIHRTVEEAAAALAPAEAVLIEEIRRSGLLHADETSWPQGPQTLWLWVFASATATLYTIAGRGKETVTRVLEGFAGWLMTDGWFSYRGYPERLRCWAHLLRKAQGLIECCDPEGSAFGHRVRSALETFMLAIYAAREGPPQDLVQTQAARLSALRRTVEAFAEHRHAKTRALAVELLNDWEAIFRVLHHPHLPLTNNLAERALRHWVIARAIGHGTRTPVGSCVFAVLASVIDTCRLRGHSPWPYLASAIAERRAGRALPPLPAMGV
jgi:transposase